MKLFQRKEVLFKKRDKETWKLIKEALKAAGMKGVRCGHSFQETVTGGGCGAKLDPRDFSGHGTIDRDIYYVKVPADQMAEAQQILKRSGIVAGIEENVLADAALRKHPEYQ